jgi:hypothetical protein
MDHESATPTRNVPLEVTPGAPSQVVVGVASGVVLAANPVRRGAAFINVSAERISFGIGVAAELDKGITLYPQGVWEMDERTFSRAQINAIASAGASTLSVQEFT